MGMVLPHKHTDYKDLSRLVALLGLTIMRYECIHATTIVKPNTTAGGKTYHLLQNCKVQEKQIMQIRFVMTATNKTIITKQLILLHYS